MEVTKVQRFIPCGPNVDLKDLSDSHQSPAMLNLFSKLDLKYDTAALLEHSKIQGPPPLDHLRDDVNPLLDSHKAQDTPAEVIDCSPQAQYLADLSFGSQASTVSFVSPQRHDGKALGRSPVAAAVGQRRQG